MMGLKELIKNNNEDIPERDEIFHKPDYTVPASKLLDNMHMDHKMRRLNEEEQLAANTTFDKAFDEMPSANPIGDAKRSLGEIEYELIILKNRFDELEQIKQQTVQLIWELENQGNNK